MRLFKRSIAVWLVALGLVCFLAACSDENDPGAPDGDVADGDGTESDLVDGDATDGDLIDGDATDGDFIDGDETDSDPLDGDATDGDLADGDLDAVDGDLDAELDAEADAEEEAGYPPAALQFRLPLNDSEGRYSEDFVYHVDHDPAVHTGAATALCTNYAGEKHIPNCYDEHHGTDYMLQGRFETMDAEVAFVYAAADGVVTHVEDGHYDRCHIDSDNLGAGNISCDGNPIRANYITIEHAGGIVTMYYHLKKNSMQVQQGDSVVCGQKLALVGSSGISSAPHLHFQVEDADGNIIDPYAGPYSQPESYWVEQDSPNGLPAERCPDAGVAD